MKYKLVPSLTTTGLVDLLYILLYTCVIIKIDWLMLTPLVVPTVGFIYNYCR